MSADPEDLVRRFAHEASGQLALVAGFADLLAAPEAPGDEERIDHARRIRAAADELRALLDALRTATR